MFKYRRIFLIIAFVLITILLSFGIFYIFFYSPTTPAPSPADKDYIPDTKDTLPISGTGTLPVADTREDQPKTTEEEKKKDKVSPTAKGGRAKTTTIYNNPTYGSIIAPNGNDILSYDKLKGKFVRITPDGEITYMSDKVFHDVETISWSPNKFEAVLEYPDGSNIIYNFKTKKQISLPKHWEDFSYSPTSEKIVAKSYSSGIENNWLIITDKNGASITPVERLGSNGDKVYNSWSPNNKVVALYAESKDFNRQNLFFIGQNQENFPLTIVEGQGFEGQWSKTGDKLLYSVYNSTSDFKPVLWTVTADGENMGQYRKNLNLNTWASKCSFADNTTIYCAVPETLKEGSGIYPEIAKKTPDNIYKINISTGVKKIIARTEDNASIQNLMLSKDGKYLYYTDKNTQKLKKILLK